MKAKMLISLGVAALALARPSLAADGMTVQTWDPALDCEHTMTTNHFDLAPGDSVEVDVDLSACPAEKLGGLLFFGYHTTKTSSRTLTSRDNVRLTLVNEQTGAEHVSDSGAVYVELDSPGRVRLFAENMSRTKSIKIRLRSSSGL
jgi:hypothetical protein